MKIACLGLLLGHAGMIFSAQHQTKSVSRPMIHQQVLAKKLAKKKMKAKASTQIRKKRHPHLSTQTSHRKSIHRPSKPKKIKRPLSPQAKHKQRPLKLSKATHQKPIHHPVQPKKRKRHPSPQVKHKQKPLKLSKAVHQKSIHHPSKPKKIKRHLSPQAKHKQKPPPRLYPKQHVTLRPHPSFSPPPPPIASHIPFLNPLPMMKQQKSSVQPKVKITQKKRLPHAWLEYDDNVATLSFGPAWSMTPANQTFYLQPDIQKTYQSSPSPSAFLDIELFWGYQKRMGASFIGQFGLEIAGTSSTTLPGDIWEDADPTFNNYTYSYQVMHTRLALKGKLLADQIRGISPYLSASAGLGFNQASGFTITPKIYQEVAAPAFNDQWSTTFAYTLGVGLERQFNKQWRVGLGYEFADWGKSQLARAPGQTLNEGLTAEHVCVNVLLLSASYVY